MIVLGNIFEFHLCSYGIEIVGKEKGVKLILNAPSVYLDGGLIHEHYAALVFILVGAAWHALLFLKQLLALV